MLIWSIGNILGEVGGVVPDAGITSSSPTSYDYGFGEMLTSDDTRNNVQALYRDANVHILSGPQNNRWCS